jgi:hypothetical protein
MRDYESRASMVGTLLTHMEKMSENSW